MSERVGVCVETIQKEDQSGNQEAKKRLNHSCIRIPGFVDSRLTLSSRVAAWRATSFSARSVSSRPGRCVETIQKEDQSGKKEAKKRLNQSCIRIPGFVDSRLTLSSRVAAWRATSFSARSVSSRPGRCVETIQK